MMKLTRRSPVHGTAGLFVAFCLPRAALASATMVATDSVDAYLAIAADGGATVFAGKVDLGTGARYPILTFPDVPQLDIALIDRRHERPLGAGEAAAAAVGAAVGNAVFDATGVRLRSAPFTPERVKAVLSGRAT